ncbi:upstream stimulatory factor 1 [Chrysoperla carnea]|uniref:upstream stimulatory factor 1 n=1 Tax=Chrysoperla carnea TaxID=189513 RepID=UPI001D094E65|nr:upstream stimulatory factor 1 [Chrysoperla carnea]
MDILEHNLDSSGESEVVGLVDSKDVLTQEQLTIVEDGSLGSGSEEHGSGSVAHLATQHLLEGDCQDGVQYAFRTGDNTTVTYRVVQVDDTTIDPLSQIVTSSNFSGSALPQVVTTPINGHLYVLGNSSEVFTTSSQRNIAPRSIPHLNSNSNTKKRDDRRRATHNEVERRRRDKINNWIIKLSKIIPDMSSDITKGNGTFEGQSKGGILAKACDYIMELRQRNQHLQECLKETEHERESLNVVEQLKTENDLLKKENLMLRQQLQINGICVPPDANDPLS